MRSSSPLANAPRTIIVSSRLPVSSSVVAGRFVLHRSTGGLVTGLAGVHGSQGSLWVGCLGGVSASTRARISPEDASELRQQGFCMVDAPQQLYDAYYEGFSNSAVWPLFHYMADRCHFSTTTWDAYRKINELFAERVAAEAQEGDRVWVHDYQLMLLPAMLRRMRRHLSVGFFLHIPFPSTEIFRILPWRREILAGMLGADLIGFHTLEYMRHFSNSVARIMGLEPQMDTLHYGRRMVRLGAFPLGLDVRGMYEDARSPEAEGHLEELRASYPARKVVLGVDRLDYTKGIPARLAAFSAFLERNPEWIGKVSLIQVSVPSRIKVDEYQEIKVEVDGLVGMINGRFGTADYVPIYYIFRNLERPYLLALYRRADVALVTPYRDGLNLVCKEYVAAKGAEPGALVLSEFAGSAAEMGEAILVNPWSQDGMITGLEQALMLSDEDKMAMMSNLWERLVRYDNKAWSAGFLSALSEVHARNRGGSYATIAEPAPEELSRRVMEARLVFLFMDYDGTLVPVVEKPELAVPPRDVLDLLRDMATIPNFRVCVVSGRDRRFLEQYLPNEIAVVAEHGACLRRAGEGEYVHLVDGAAFLSLRDNVLAVMSNFEHRIPGSRIEQKEFGVVWHYRMADPIFAHQQALVLADTLGGLLQRTPLGVLIAKKAVEVRHVGVNKGDAVRAILEQERFDPEIDVIMTMGDDRTDEDMFRVYPNENISISVSETPMVAAYVMEQDSLVRLLQTLTRTAKGWQYRLWEQR